MLVKNKQGITLDFFFVLEIFHAYPKTCVRTFEASNLVQFYSKFRVVSRIRGFLLISLVHVKVDLIFYSC